jgi:hypothetical protein
MTADGCDFEVTADMVSCMIEGIDWLREQPGRMFVEQRVRLDPWLPGQFGYLDIGIVDGETCTIFDWKFGFILVETVDNEQLRAYALGFYKSILMPLGYAPTRFRIIIEQSRAPGGKRFWQPWEISLAELLPFGDTMAQAMAAADAPNAPRHAGEKQCFFCEAKKQPGGCPENSAFMLDLVSQKFDDLDDGVVLGAAPALPESGRITPERRSFIVRHAAMFKSWLARLDAEMLDDAVNGRPTPGMKAVAGQRGDRKWRDKERAEALLVWYLAEGAFTKKLISPAAGEKVLKPRGGHEGRAQAWDQLKDLIDQDEGRPILVPDTDPRPALLTWDQKFDDEET